MSPYNDYRLLCGLSYANNFDDLLDHIPKQVKHTHTHNI